MSTARERFDVLVDAELGQFSLNMGVERMTIYFKRRQEMFLQFVENGYELICNEEVFGLKGKKMVCCALCGPCPEGKLCNYANMIGELLIDHVYPQFGRG